MRIGVLVDTLKLSGWRKAVLDRVTASSNTQLALMIHDKSDRRQRFNQRVWGAIDLAEQRFAKRLLHQALARSRGFTVNTLDGGVLDLSGAGLPSAPATQHDIIRDANLDVIVDLTHAAGEGVEHTLARHGVWRIVSRRAPHDRDSPLGFWEYYRGEPLTEVSIVAREGASDTEIATACYCTFPWSWSTNDLLLGLKAAWLLEDTLLKRDRREPLPARSAHSESGQSQSVKARGLGHAPLMLFRNTTRLAGDAAERTVSEDRWRILLSRGNPLEPRRDAPTVIESPPHSYWADPFVLMKGNRCHIFFEEYLYAPRRGVISHICIEDPKPGETLRDIRSTIVIDQPHHLSYPFIFTHQGETFMMPESSAAQTVDIWRATDFPHGWTRVASPLSGIAAADSSLLEWDGRWWLFTNIDRSGMRDHRSELHVFYATDPIAGPWTPHAGNPVVVDASCGRMAGGFLTAADGRPIRCGQVQGRKYGQEVSYRLITELTESTYAETPLTGIKPIAISPGARTHHLSARDGMIVADECFVTPKWNRARR